MQRRCARILQPVSPTSRARSVHAVACRPRRIHALARPAVHCVHCVHCSAGRLAAPTTSGPVPADGGVGAKGCPTPRPAPPSAAPKLGAARPMPPAASTAARCSSAAPKSAAMCPAQWLQSLHLAVLPPPRPAPLSRSAPPSSRRHGVRRQGPVPPPPDRHALGRQPWCFVAAAPRPGAIPWTRFRTGNPERPGAAPPTARPRQRSLSWRTLAPVKRSTMKMRARPSGILAARRGDE